ncbi:DUF4974 domain-containing protein [Sphingobacterium sp. lm-10]|uniref:FecR family protein n=1 Tax=Sphingobacterium sp. lm-10 TaxID=2944904 RepID=UPI002021EAF1|nr:FecR family protein [Sphingobacterium sp. lm-10]MCL7986405.1 DUF4974 domain-containing protein [Sphingobacterium sp. lm-10]
MTTKYRIIELLRKERTGVLDAHEKRELTDWLSIPKNTTLYHKLKDIQSEKEALDQLAAYETETQLTQILDILSQEKFVRKPKRNWFKVAAWSAACLAAAMMIISQFSKPDEQVNSLIAPGTDKAILTLEDGSIVPLSDLATGVDTSNGYMRVYEDSEGRPVYEYTGSDHDKQGWHTITTPKGGQYTVKLPDGSTIWLNAASKLSYPLNFLADRKVKLEGEGYFDVKKLPQTDKTLAHFTVELPGHSVQVLGTQFNINAYQENAQIETTLIAGKVQISAEGSTRVLRPGQQARVSSSGLGDILIQEVDTRSFSDWKDGYFYFDDIQIQDIMKKIAKWYDIEVIYSGTIPKEKFGGEISRFENLQELLDLLEMTEKIHFKVEGRRVTVMP